MSYPVPEVPTGKVVQSAAKAVAATITAVSGVVALFVTAVADGSVSGAEWGTILTGVLTGVATVAGVWKTRNVPVLKN